MKANVKIIDKVERKDIYDFVFLTVKENQVHKALQELRHNDSPNIVTMVNTLESYDNWERICGIGRILPAFPGAGGSFENDILYASLTPWIIQPTTIGEIRGNETLRLQQLKVLFKKSHIPYQIVKDMHQWQLCHLAMVVPIADAYYEAICPEKAGYERKLMMKTATKMKRNFCTLYRLGVILSPIAMAASEECREAVRSIIEILFPPKEVTVTPEGLPESVPHVAQGQEPTEDAPGFAIYVDEGRYEMTEENGVFFIRPKKTPLSREDVRQNNSALLEGLTVEEQDAFIDDWIAEQEAFYAALPPCEMEIRELEGTDIETAAAAARTEMTQAWETVTEVENEDFRLNFFTSAGSAWDAPQENHYFYPNGEQRVYHIIIRYYLEAEEGHGTRFRTMLETFSVIDSSITQP